RYTTVAHCGACGINCASVAVANATAVCDAGGDVPRCDYACTGGAVDVNGLSDDGCECLPTPGDDLAGDGLDSNCDGVDGDVTKGIFVSKDGVDTAPGTREAPVRTITRGLQRAAGALKRDVYVATGVYSESVALKPGLGVFGGYSPDFSEREPLLYETAILGGTPTTNLPGTVVAVDLGGAQQGATVLDGFTI
ncbi:MAG: DUF1565 domain-containing protein, partial [Myxococcales bacterium]|nr:DUF1565 domain-containing protein [Myxococcales bacterium]